MVYNPLSPQKEQQGASHVCDLHPFPMLQRVATELCCFKGEKLKQLGDDGTIERNSRPVHFPIPRSYFGISSVDIFYFPGRKGKILRTYRLILRKFQLIPPRKFFFLPWKMENRSEEL